MNVHWITRHFSRIAAALLLVSGALLFIVGCVTPKTVNQQAYYIESLAQVVGQSCIDMSMRGRVGIDQLMHCKSVYEQAIVAAETARALGESADSLDRLEVAQRLLMALEADLKAREGK